MQNYREASTGLQEYGEVFGPLKSAEESSNRHGQLKEDPTLHMPFASTDPMELLEIVIEVLRVDGARFGLLTIADSGLKAFHRRKA